MMNLKPLWPTCREVTERLAQSDYEDSPEIILLGMKIHLSICGPCVAFLKQIKFMSKAMVAKFKAQREIVGLDQIQQRILTSLRSL